MSGNVETTSASDEGHRKCLHRGCTGMGSSSADSKPGRTKAEKRRLVPRNRGTVQDTWTVMSGIAESKYLQQDRHRGTLCPEGSLTGPAGW